MLHLLDESLEAMLRAVVPLDPREVDVAFAAPDKAWGARVTRPTISLFLFDIHRSAHRSVAGVDRTQRDGREIRRLALPRIEFSYLVTAWTTEPRDEHQLLGSVLR
ncbi:MAG: Pvc16 family protein, partial [Acidimicrobiales bacterium]